MKQKWGNKEEYQKLYTALYKFCKGMAVTLGQGLAKYWVCIYLAYLIFNAYLSIPLPFDLHVTSIILFI